MYYITKYFLNTYHKILFVFAIDAILHAVEALLFVIFRLAAELFALSSILNQALRNKTV